VADSLIVGLEEMIRHDPSLSYTAPSSDRLVRMAKQDAEWQRGPR